MSNQSPWKFLSGETVASYLPESEFKGLLERRIAIPPDHLAILLRDGEVVLASEGAHLSVGGLWQRAKELFGGKHALRMLVADLKPFRVVADLEAWTRDQVEIRGELTFELQLDPNRPTDVLGLVADAHSVTKGDLLERLLPHIGERDVVAEMVQHDAAELRANSGLQDRIQAQVMRTCERVIGDLGLLVRATSVNWAMSDAEREAIAQARVQRERNRLEFDHQHKLRDLELAREETEFRIRVDGDVDKARAAADSELEQLLLQNKIALEGTRSAEERKQEVEALANQLQLARNRRLAHQEEILAAAETELDRSRIELGTQKLRLEFETEARRVEMVLKEEEALAELRIAEKGADLQHRKLSQLQELELDKKRAEQQLRRDEVLTQHTMDLEAEKARSDAELEKLRLQGELTPDQLLAIQAGASPEVARVFAERAREAQGEEKQALLREMLEMQKAGHESSQDALGSMLDKAMDTMARVASGVGAARGGSTRGKGADGDESQVECPQCHHQGPVSDRFCSVCGHQMRT
jgi:hypothetical protein